MNLESTPYSLGGLRVVLSETFCVENVEFPRPWWQRLFWKPWKSHRELHPKRGAFKFGNTLIFHPDVYAQLKAENRLEDLEEA